MPRKVAFVEFPVLSGVLPLASGYMEASCRKDPLVAGEFEFEKLSMPVKTPAADVLEALQQSSADVYAFSCYVWNMRLVRRAVDDLLSTRPEAHFILGGPQVMHQAGRYIRPEQRNIFVCNGEGERTFPGFLGALASGEDFATVRSLSYMDSGRLVTTEPEPRIKDLSEIPSPFLEGLFASKTYTWALIETNRGCPFKCNYCYWGAATGAKVFRYDDQRIENELTWIAKSRCLHLFIADANWGIFERDVEISRFIAECKRTYGAPLTVYFCGAKNRPDRVAEITRVFHEAGLISSQSISLQTLNPETLRQVNRENIRISTYTNLQEDLNRHSISSFIEMIWPLPGETLDSFKKGLATLCEMDAEAFIVYPLLLMNNVELNEKREEYGLVTVPDQDPNSEAEIVVGTNVVDGPSHREGVRYVYAVTTLYSLRGLWCLSRYLTRSGVMDYASLFDRFLAFCRSCGNNTWWKFCEDSIQKLEIANFSNTGALVHLVLHENREEIDELLWEFVRSQDFWADRTARFLFEVDLLNRPYIYVNTPVGKAQRVPEEMVSSEPFDEGYLIQIPAGMKATLKEYVALQDGEDDSGIIEVNHRRSQLPFMRQKSLHEHYLYCQDASQRIRHILPVWRCSSLNSE